MVSARDYMLPHLKKCELVYYSGKLRVKPIASLNMNEYQYDVSPKVVEALKAEAPRANFYVHLGDGPTGELREKIAKYVGVDIENIALDESLDQALNRIPKAFVGGEDNVVTMSPTYPELECGTNRMGGGGAKKVLLEEPDFDLDPDAILEACDEKTKIVFLCNPNNPTSSKYSRDDILKVVENAKAVVIVDECYYEYCKETVADVVNEYKNLYVARSFSKGFGLAGAKMAYYVGSDEACDTYMRTMSGFEFNRFGVFGAMAALGDLGYYKDIWKKVNEEKARMADEFTKLGMKVWDSATSFLFMDVSATGKTSTEIKDMFLDDYRILVRDVNGTFPELDKKYVSFGTGKPEINDMLIEGFKKCFS